MKMMSLVCACSVHAEKAGTCVFQPNYPFNWLCLFGIYLLSRYLTINESGNSTTMQPINTDTGSDWNDNTNLSEGLF
jgi:hypothetical protein